MDAEPNDKHYKLTKIYCYVHERFQDCLQYGCERFSNNERPKPTDQGIVAIYSFAMHHQGIFKLKQTHRFAKDYLLDWFPDLGSYRAFSNRINRGRQCHGCP